MTLKDSFEDLLWDAMDAASGDKEAQMRLNNKLSSLTNATQHAAKDLLEKR